MTAFAAFPLALLLSASVPAATGQPAAVLVLDASGSMWGRIGDRTKIEIAREAVSTMLDRWDGETEVGLIAYGHRRKGDCDDIELLQPPGPLDAAALRARIDAVQPKGMTPIAESVRRAAAALRSTERKATVILVSDGEETCGADPCALGAELEAGGVDFTAHVIGFDLDARGPAREQLACLARATGGLFLDAADAAQLDSALRQAAAAAVDSTPPATTACGRFVGGEPYAEGLQTWPSGGTAGNLEEADRQLFDSVELAADANPRQCQALCDQEARCAAWWFEPIGSNFRTLPVCFRWDAAVALTTPRPGHEGTAMGIKPGHALIEIEAGAACAPAE
ncbi:MAG TPA: VWA domain-containing protein [Dokdonella sp.]|uniref:vWA domain-containing protein n=1 Tax=Dokdonella sp. TaxID=2291710 RepID=UPI002C69E186|nr:VWA domain-containing protein [Dokdonella sp.]HUD43575.1 VWA domain-containing protein [Dokdonella sp.]